LDLVREFGLGAAAPAAAAAVLLLLLHRFGPTRGPLGVLALAAAFVAGWALLGRERPAWPPEEADAWQLLPWAALAGSIPGLFAAAPAARGQALGLVGGGAGIFTAWLVLAWRMAPGGVWTPDEGLAWIAGLGLTLAAVALAGEAWAGHEDRTGLRSLVLVLQASAWSLGILFAHSARDAQMAGVAAACLGGAWAAGLLTGRAALPRGGACLLLLLGGALLLNTWFLTGVAEDAPLAWILLGLSPLLLLLEGLPALRGPRVLAVWLPVVAGLLYWLHRAGLS